MIRLKGNAGTGNVIQAVRHARSVFSEIRAVQSMRDDELFAYAKDLRVPVELVQQVKAAGRLPVVTFAAGGLATPADVAMLMELGVDGVFVGSGIFKGENPAQMRDERGRRTLPCWGPSNPALPARGGPLTAAPLLARVAARARDGAGLHPLQRPREGRARELWPR